MDTIRVIIIDEQPLFRQGICSTLEQMGDCVILGTCTDATEVLELVRTGNPDLRSRLRHQFCANPAAGGAGAPAIRAAPCPRRGAPDRGRTGAHEAHG